MLNPDQFKALEPEIWAHSIRSQDHDDDPISSPFWQEHNHGHGSNPIYNRMGWGNEHNCLYTGCSHENHGASDWDSPVQTADPRRGIWTDHTVNPRGMKMVAQESVVDTDHLGRLIEGRQIHRKNTPPLLVPFGGAMHIRDGGHRLLAAAIRNEPLNVRVYRGE